jgi:hypothetical protein
VVGIVGLEAVNQEAHADEVELMACKTALVDVSVPNSARIAFVRVHQEANSYTH